MSFTLTNKPSVGDIPKIERDTFVLRLVQIGDPMDVPAFGEDGKPDPEKMRTRFRLDWEIADYAGDEDADDMADLIGTRVSEWFTATLHERGKLRPYVIAMLARDIEVGEELEMQSLLGTLIKADVWSKDNGYLAIDAPKAHKRRSGRARAVADGDIPF